MKNLSDMQLFQLCQQYGRTALEARRKFLGLIPEVNRRRLYEKHGFSGIFEFAFKLGGVSEEQVYEILQLERKIADKLTLHSQLVEGKISHNKIARVASVVTTKNENFWAAQVANLSKSALNTLVKDEKTLQNTLSGQISLPDSISTSNVELKAETANRLIQLKEKGIDIDGIINQALDEREQAIAEDKTELAKIPAKSRYIPVKIRKVLTKEHGNKCSIPGCKKPAVTIHHTQRFALSRSHDPNYLSPMCEDHHEIAHKIDLKYSHYK